jgi:hypothetical protein
VANVRADRPPRSRVGLLDRNKATSDALTVQLQAMQETEQRLLAGRQAQARRTRALALGAIGLSVLLGVAGGVAAVLLFTAGVTRRAALLEGNAERLAGGLPLLPTPPAGDALGALAGGLERAAVLLGEREQALRQARDMLEHIVAWSPMVMFRGLLGGRGQAYVSATSSASSATPPTRCWAAPASGSSGSTRPTGTASPRPSSGRRPSGRPSSSRSTASCSRTATAGCTG